jgi:hypothetical protein
MAAQILHHLPLRQIQVVVANLRLTQVETQRLRPHLTGVVTEVVMEVVERFSL